MNDPRFRISQEESKRLFQNLQRDAQTLFDEIYSETSGDALKDLGEYEGDYRQELWQACDDELRAAYELSRFGLDVEGLDGYQENIEIFRLNCEDINGMDPLDVTLVSELLRQQTELEDTIQYHAMSRYTIPMNAERKFGEHMHKMRELFDDLDKQTQQVDVPKSTSVLDGLPDLERFKQIVDAASKNVEEQKRVLRILPR